MPQIRPITDLRNTTEISEACHSLNEPIFITKNGYGDLVVMSIETYEKQMIMTDIYSKLAVGENDIKNGNVVDADIAFAQLRKKYGQI